MGAWLESREDWAGCRQGQKTGGTQGLEDGKAPQALHPMSVPPLALASQWDSTATGRPAMAFIGLPTHSAMPTAQSQGSRTA